MKLEETIHKIVKDVVNEELGINTTVTNTVYEIITKINNLSQNNYRYISHTTKIKYPCKLISFDYSFIKNMTIRIVAHIFDFNDEEELARLKHNDRTAFFEMMSAKTNSTSLHKNIFTVTINVIRINGKIDTHVYEVLQHEIEHVFQLSLKNGRLTKRLDTYAKYSSIMKNGNNLIKRIAYIEYARFKFEIDAFINSLYVSLRQSHCHKENIDKVITQSSCYKVCINLRNIIKTISPLKESISANKEVILQFNFDINTAIKHGEHTLHNILNKIGKVKTLYLKEIEHDN